MTATKVVKLADLSREQQDVVRALIAAKNSALEDRVTASRAASGLGPKLTDPVALARVAALIVPALRRLAINKKGTSA